MNLVIQLDPPQVLVIEKPAELIAAEWLSIVIRSLLTSETGTQKASGVKVALQ